MNNMKKKFVVFAMLLVMLPLLALAGCGTPDSFYVEAVSSWTGLPSGTLGGTVAGSGSYNDGSKVKLVATAKPDSRFIAWVYEDNLLIKANSTFSISNTTASNKTTKSELSFKASKKTKGKYTAIFDDNKIVYAMLTSWRLTDNITLEGEDANTSSARVIGLANLYVSQGNISTDVYSAMNFEVRNNVINKTGDIKDVLKLNANEPQELVVDFTLAEDLANFSKMMKAQITFAETDEDFVEVDPTYSYKVNFTQNGTYEIIFKFSIGGTTKYLVVEYSNLNVIF